MIARVELVKIARAYLRDANILYRKQSYDGAVYLCGYAVEIALKARICQTLKWTDFPLTSGEFQNVKSLQTHNFEALLRFSGIAQRIIPAYLSDWSLLSNWNPELRYSPVGTQTQVSASNMLVATRNLVMVLLPRS